MTATKGHQQVKSIDDLIQTQREMNAPPPPPPTKLQLLLEKQRDIITNRWESLDIVLGGELVPIEIGQVFGRVWMDLEAHHFPDVQEDIPLGYNRRTLPSDYPADRIKIRGEHTDQGTWQAIWDLLDDENRTNVSAVIWGINIGEPQALHERLTDEMRSTVREQINTKVFAAKQAAGG